MWDSWFQQLAASSAVRERKEDFKKIILDFVKERKNKNLRFMNLACGPLREIKELSERVNRLIAVNVIADLSSRGHYPKKMIEWLRENL